MGFGKFLVGGIVCAAVPAILPAVAVSAGAIALGSKLLRELPVEQSNAEPTNVVLEQVASKRRVARKCSSCSAPISGITGEVAFCCYCDSEEML